MGDPTKVNHDPHVTDGASWDDQSSSLAVALTSKDGSKVSGVEVENGAMHIALGDTSSVDAFNRLRVSQQIPLFISKNTHSKHASKWCELTSGGTETITWLPDEVAVELKVGTASGEYAIRQADRPAVYFPGSSQLIYMTGVFGAAKANVTRRVGVFYDEDGVFFEQTSAGLFAVIRSSVSGSIVDTRIAQADWNRDKLDGTGPSGVTLDLTNSQLFYMDYQHLGVGGVRFGFSIGSRLIIGHAVDNSNQTGYAYMARATLPARYEIRNTGVAASATTLKEMCVGIYKEGGEAIIGLEFAKGNGVAVRTGITVAEPIFAIRLKDSVLVAPNDKPNRTIARLLGVQFWAEDKNTYFEVFHVHEPSSITATWTDVDDSSALEFSRDISAFAAPHSHEVLAGYSPAGAAGKGDASFSSAENATEHGLIYQNSTSDNSHLFVVCATSLPGTAAKAAANLTWVEYE